MPLIADRGGTRLADEPAAVSLTTLVAYLVADANGNVLGRVECPMYGTHPERPDALAVRSGFMRGRRIVPADAIGAVDQDNEVVTLRIAGDAVRRFL